MIHIYSILYKIRQFIYFLGGFMLKEKLSKEIKSIKCADCVIENSEFMKGDTICISPLDLLSQLLHQQVKDLAS